MIQPSGGDATRTPQICKPFRSYCPSPEVLLFSLVSFTFLRALRKVLHQPHRRPILHLRHNRLLCRPRHSRLYSSTLDPACLDSHSSPTGQPCRGRSLPAFWELQAGSMRTGPFEATRFEATPSNAAVWQSLQVIEERATAAFWFEADHQKSLRFEANARRMLALQPAVEYAVAAAKRASAATLAAAERFADAVLLAADATTERAANRIVVVAVAAPGFLLMRAADLYLSIALAAAVMRVALCTNVATVFRNKRGEPQRKQALHSGDESGDEGDVVNVTVLDQAKGEDVDGLITEDDEDDDNFLRTLPWRSAAEGATLVNSDCLHPTEEEHPKEMTESQKIIAAFEVELESENFERAVVASTISEIERIEKVEAVDASMVSELERVSKVEAERRDELPPPPSEEEVEDFLPTLPWRRAVENATLIKEAGAAKNIQMALWQMRGRGIMVAAAEAEAAKVETASAEAAAMAAREYSDRSNIYSPLVTDADTDTDSGDTDTDESVDDARHDDATTVLHGARLPPPRSCPCPRPCRAVRSSPLPTTRRKRAGCWSEAWSEGTRIARRVCIWLSALLCSP